MLENAVSSAANGPPEGFWIFVGILGGVIALSFGFNIAWTIYDEISTRRFERKLRTDRQAKEAPAAEGLLGIDHADKENKG